MPVSRIEKTDFILLFVVTIFFYLLVFKLPFDPIYHEGDHLVFLYNADRMLQGDRMYVDFFSYYVPGGQLWYCLLFLIFGTKAWLLNLTIILIGSSTFWVTLRISKRLIAGPYAYLPAMIFALFGFRWFGLDGSHRTISPLFVLLAIWILLRGRDYLHLALAGLFCAMASFFTQRDAGLVAVASIALFVLADNFARGWRWITALKECLALGSAFIVSLSLMCAYFVAAAGIETFVWSVFVYPAKYYRFHEENDLGTWLLYIERSLAPGARMGEFLPIVFYSFVVPLALVLFLLVFWKNGRRSEWSLWSGPLLVAMVGACQLLSSTAPSAGHLFNICVPSLILFIWLFYYFEFLKRRQTIVATLAAAGLLVAAVSVAIRFQTRTDYLEMVTARGKVFALDDGQNRRYLWLQEHAKPGDYVLDVPFPFVYFLLDMRNATRYAQFFPTDYTRPEFAVNAVEDLKRTRPRYIVWVDSYNKPDSERAPGDHLGPMSKYIIEEYTPTGPVYPATNRPEPMRIWERKPASTDESNGK